MAAPKGHARYGGREKGSKNKRNFDALELASKHKVDPLEVLLMIAAGDWKGLGYDAPVYTAEKNGSIWYEDRIKLSDRLQASKEATKYLYPARQSVAISSDPEGFSMVVTDYTKKDENK